MDLGEILRVMRNRWYLMVPIMVLTSALTVLAYLVLPTSYESTSTVSLLTAERASIVNKSGNTNPYLTFDASLVATADFLSRSLSSKGSTDELKSLGVTEEYTVALADNAQGPFISIVVMGTDEAKVLRSTTALTNFAARKLTDIQAASGVKPADMIRLTVIVPPQKPEALIKDKLQLVIAIAAAGTAAAFVITFVTEGLSRSRRAAGLSAGPAVSSVQAVVPSPRSVASTVIPPAEQPSPAKAEDNDRTVIFNRRPGQRSSAPAQRISSPAPVTTSAEETQIISIGSADRTGSKSPVARRGIGPPSSTTVYHSNTTNGKSQEDGDSVRKR